MQTQFLLRLLFGSATLCCPYVGFAQENHSIIESLWGGPTGRKWSLAEIKTTDNQIIERASTVQLQFQKDLSGIREEKTTEGTSHRQEVKSRFRYEVDTVSNELVIRFKNISIERGRHRHIVTEPKLDAVSEFRMRFVNRGDNKPLLRLTYGGSGAKPGVHYYFE